MEMSRIFSIASSNQSKLFLVSFFYSFFSVDSGSEAGDIDSFDNGEWFLFVFSFLLFLLQ